MRGDMPKVIVERARRGARPLRKGRALRDDDLSLSDVAVKIHDRSRGRTKSLNENLNPLKRFLEKQVGRPWSKVWAEVCENLKPTNTVQQHVRDHIPDFVAMKTSMKGGEVWVHERWAPVPLKLSYSKLFVDPKSGLLRRNKYFVTWRAKKRERREIEAKMLAARMRVVSAATQLHLLDDGAWWEVTLAPVPTGVREMPTRNGMHRYEYEHGVGDAVISAGLSTLGREDLYARRGVHAVAKRQLSKKEMRDLKLR